MPFVELMGTIIENLEVGDPIEIFLTQDGVLFRKIRYNPKNELFTDYGWIHRQTTKKRKKRMSQISLSVFLTPKES